MATAFPTPQMLRTRADTELTLEEVGLLVLGAIRDSLSRSVYSVREDELVPMLLRQHPYLARRGIQVHRAFKTCSLLKGSQFAQWAPTEQCTGRALPHSMLNWRQATQTS